MAKQSPKLGARTGAPTWMSRGHTLADDARESLRRQLGVSSASDADTWVRGVNYWLGFYPGGVQALDNAPRPKDYVRTYARLRLQTGKLLNDLASLPEFYREKYEIQETPLGDEGLEAALQMLAKLFDATRQLERQYEGEKSAGRPKKLALSIAIKGLRDIFRRHYEGPVTKRPARGPVRRLAECEEREREFVRVAFTDAGIDVSNLTEMLRDTRCIPDAAFRGT